MKHRLELRKGGQAMKSRGWIVVGVLLFTVSILAIGLERADAGSCGLTASCNLELTASNVTQLTPIDVRVTWDNTGATTVLSVQYASGGPGTPKFINEFAYNSAVLTTKVTYHGADVTTLWIGTGPPSPQINQ